MRMVHDSEWKHTQTQPDVYTDSRWEAVLGATGIGLWEWEPTGNIWRPGKEMLRLLKMGYAARNPDFETRGGMLYEGDRARVAAELSPFLAGECTTFSVRYRAVCGDGSLACVEEKGVATSRSAAGVPQHVAGTVRIDIRSPEREGACVTDGADTDNPADLRLIALDAAPFCSMLFDDRLQLLDCNPESLSCFGFGSREEMISAFAGVRGAAIQAAPFATFNIIAFVERLREAVKNCITEFEMDLMLGGARTTLRVACNRILHRNTHVIAVYVEKQVPQEKVRDDLLRQERLLLAINNAASSLVSAQPEVFHGVVNRCLVSIGRAVGAGRVHLWENYEEDGALCAKLLFEWCTGGERKSINEAYVRSRYDDTPFWRDVLTTGHSINLPVAQLPEKERALFESEGIHAVLMIPILFQGQFWGVLGLDNRRERVFTDTEVQILQSAGILLVSGILRNQLTQRLIRTSEEALASTRAKSDFLSRMSHEIRTPMNAIIGMTTLARKAADPEHARQCLDKIDTASRQLLGIINDVLDMSKIESGKFEITSGPFDFEKMMRNVFNVMQVKMEEKHIDFNFDFQDIFTHMMVADELRLSQVMLNLLGNAVKFTPELGAISLKVRHWPKEDAPGTSVLHVEVRDTGIGISDEQSGRLFCSFEQADGGITRRFGGTGLGLAICKKIVNLMGGDIWVESVVDEGSCFLFEVEVAWGEPCRSGQARGIHDDVRVLVVDDSEDMLEYYHNIFAGFDIPCTTAGSAAVAVELVERAQVEGKPYSIIFLDWGMPGKNVGETAREIKRVMGDNGNVVMIAATDCADIEPEFAAIGIRQCLAKPILPSMLYNTVVELTEKTCIQENTVYDWSDKCILVVEDMEINREIITSVLEDSGVTIESAENGLEAVEAMERDPARYDLILMDVQMPVLDGLDATGRIRALANAWARRVPIVAMTANAFKEDVQACIASGMNNHIAKPIDVGELTAKLAEYLGGSPS